MKSSFKRDTEKQKLLLYIAPRSYRQRNVIAATLAWAANDAGWLFDVYYGTRRTGIHYGGGDPLEMDQADLAGGTFLGGRHLEQLYFLLLSFDVTIVSSISTEPFAAGVRNLVSNFLGTFTDAPQLYHNVFRNLGMSFPDSIVITENTPREDLPDLDAYSFPEICYQKALGLEVSCSEAEIRTLVDEKSKVFGIYLSPGAEERLINGGIPLRAIDRLLTTDNYASLTARIAQRWKSKVKGWILADPDAVSYWIPRAYEENRIAMYGKPQAPLIREMAEELDDVENKVVLGRQYDDRDFFELSRTGLSLQVIDPVRPPFSSAKHADYSWPPTEPPKAVTPSDEMLEAYAREGKVLACPIFWTGMIRELENLYNILELVAITNLKGGIVLTTFSFDYMMNGPVELLGVPLSEGGVFPNVEVLLGSCGTGVAIESLLPPGRLAEQLSSAFSELNQRVPRTELLPRGWWGTMDAVMEHLPMLSRPRPVRLQRKPPFLQIRYHGVRGSHAQAGAGPGQSSSLSAKKQMARRLRQAGMGHLMEQYRPYEFFKAGPIHEGIPHAVKESGLDYMFTKSGFGKPPTIMFQDGEFVALNYTTGQWDGWTPFETINSVNDLRKSESRLLNSRKPGWLVGTIDSCLWTFGGHLWDRSKGLIEIARFFVRGGDSGRLINVTPGVIARYARIVSRLASKEVSVYGRR